MEINDRIHIQVSLKKKKTFAHKRDLNLLGEKTGRRGVPTTEKGDKSLHIHIYYGSEVHLPVIPCLNHAMMDSYVSKDVA